MSSCFSLLHPNTPSSLWSCFPVHTIMCPPTALSTSWRSSCPWSHFTFPVSATIPDYVLHLKTGAGSPQWQKTWTFFFLGLVCLIWSSLVPSIYLQGCWFHSLYIWIVLKCKCTTFSVSIHRLKDICVISSAVVMASQWVNSCLWGRISLCQGVFIAASVVGSALGWLLHWFL